MCKVSPFLQFSKHSYPPASQYRLCKEIHWHSKDIIKQFLLLDHDEIFLSRASILIL